MGSGVAHAKGVTFHLLVLMSGLGVLVKTVLQTSKHGPADGE